MSSRRLMNRSLSSDGRSYYSGSDMGSQNRGSRSYLSSVRSESSYAGHRFSQFKPSRSTLCSVMAQITEDIQPTFESTLKSKAVSEEANVKFSCVVSGHPVPDVTWYKDDLQLDRYCGLPKYEISRDDKTHTLQIYNCTLDDAAIYQASAQNSRGIVSCSGVLEVGTMSEYKIHQNYFAKLKLRNENRRREQEESRNTGKENMRMSSPERAQRKRRSPMESSRRAGSPSEERAVEGDAFSQTPSLEDRLAAPEQATADLQRISNAEIITHKDKDSEVLTYIHDTVHNGASKQLKKAKILTTGTESSKENRATGRREEVIIESETSIEKMEVQSTDSHFVSLAESDSKTNKKLSEIVNKSVSEESKRGQGAQITLMNECRNKMDITDTKTNEKLSTKVNKTALEELKRGAQTTAESRNKMDITDTKTNEKLSAKVNKTALEELKRGAQTTAESRNKMDITDTKTNEKLSTKVNKTALEELKRGAQTTAESKSKIGIIDTKKSENQSVFVKKLVSQELNRTQFPSLTKTRNKVDITDTRKSEKESVNVNKSTSGESKRDQSAEASVAGYGRKMDLKDTKTNEKLSVNKSASEDSTKAEGPKISFGTESRNKIDTKTTEKTNKSTLEESKLNQDVQKASVAESRNKIIDTKQREKQSMNANKSVLEESKTASVAQIASETESRNKIFIKDTKTKTEKLPVKVNKSASEESKINQSAQAASVNEYRNKMGIRDTRKTEKQSVSVIKSVSEETKKVQGAQLASVTESKIKSDLTETKKSEKHSETPKESTLELKKAQKPIAAQKQPMKSVSMTTQTNEVAESTKLTKPSGKGTSNFNAPDTIQNCNSIFIDNKLKDFDDHRDSNPVGTCVKILPNSCGGNDVNVDTGERNASARSLRGLAAGDAHSEPTEPPTPEDASPVHTEAALELKEQPTLMREVTASVTETLNSCHLTSQEQKQRAGDQSVASTKSNTLVTGPQNTQLSEKISPGHVSHKLQGGQVTTAMSSSLGDDTLSNMCQEDSKDENQHIKESDKLKSETKPASMSLNNMEENELKNISTDVHVANTTSEEKSTENSQHSKNQVIVSEFAQICISNSDVVKAQSIKGSSDSDVQMKDTNAQEFQITSAAATDYIAKKAKQEQSDVTTSEVQISTHHEMQSCSVKKGTDDSGPSTFLSQHSKASPTEFTIPAIYITDVDNIQNSSAKAHTVDNAEIRKEANAETSNLRNNNTVNQISDTSNSTDATNKTTAAKSESLYDLNLDLSLHSQPSKFNSQENIAVNVPPDINKSTEATIQHHNSEKSIKTDDSETMETSRLNKTDLKLRNNSESFVKQLKEAALDLEITNQPSIKISAAQQMNAKAKVKFREKANLAEKQPGACKETVPMKTEDAAHSDLLIRTEQKTTFPKTKTEKSEIEMAVCLGKANRDTNKEKTLSLKTQPASPSQSISNSPLMPSLQTHSPRLSRRTVPIDPPNPAGNDNIKPKSTEKDKENQFKVPQVIRKIRPEVFDASGHLKLWCQFFNIVSDSTIKWFKDEVEITEINRSAGDETQLCLAIIHMSKRDCGVYRCTITNEYGKDSTEYLLSTEFLSNMFLREELHEVGEEIEMTPLIFSKGLADPGCWGSKFYGRITTEEAQVGLGCEHKTRRVKVIYGLDPVFESGSSCFMKIRSPIVYESREETVLAERNLQITKQDCRIQNMAREYFKIFATETRVIESFGAALEVIPLYFTYCPASSVPYATVEAELKGVYLRYCGLDRSGTLAFNEKSEVGQKCCALQHWIHQWTNGNVLFSRLEGVETILTNIGIAVRTKGYQGFPCEANPRVFDQFQIQHQCNYFCGLLNLKPLKAPETLPTPARSKGSSSPLLQRRAAPNSSSPQTPRKATKSPKVSRKLNPETST